MDTASFICSEKEEGSCSKRRNESLVVRGWIEKVGSQRCYPETISEICTESEYKNLEPGARITGIAAELRVMPERRR